jgi:hypothetical protein
MLSIRQTLPAVLLAVLLQACAAQQRQVNSLAERLEQSTPEATLLSLQSISPPGRDRAQYLLNTGLLKSISGDFESANRDLQSAKEILNSLQAVSVSENLGAAMVNETLRSYDGSASERVLLHELLSINYLMLNNLEAARVEVLQADVVMKELASEDNPIGQLASAHYVAGLVYELGGELDDAMISYRKAANIMALRDMSPPPALESSLLSLSQHLGLDEEHEKYREQFSFVVKPHAANAAEIIVIYWDGVVTSKRGNSLSVWVLSLDQAVSLALPYYPPSNYVKKPFELSMAGQHHRTETIEDIEVLSREDLDDESAAVYAMTLARMVSKYQLVKTAGKQNNSLGLLINIATMLTESADTRSWNMLPSSIQFARFWLPAGEYSLPFPHYSGAQHAEPVETKLVVSAGEKIVLFVPGVSQKIFSYTLASRSKPKRKEVEAVKSMAHEDEEL